MVQCECGCKQTFKQNTGRGRKRQFYNEACKKRYSRMKPDKEFNTISWGCGLQSTVMAVMVAMGDLPKVDAIIFSDTGWERQHTYDIFNFYKEWLQGYGLAVFEVNHGNLKESALSDTGYTRLPLFTKDRGQLKRHCTRDYKIRPLRRKIRSLIGVEDKGPVSQYKINTWLGITIDEIDRMAPSRVKWITNEFPLIDKGMTRDDCKLYLQNLGLPIPAKSSCVGCPYHSNGYWLDMKNESPNEWQEACQFDEKIRDSKISQGIEGGLYLHYSGVPLKDAKLRIRGQKLEQAECTGYCFL